MGGCYPLKSFLERHERKKGESSWAKRDSEEEMTSPVPAEESELVVFGRWFRYIAAARAAYLDAFARIPRQSLTEDRGASHPSILDIFAHALLAHQNWLLYAYHDGAEPPSKSAGWTLSETRELARSVQDVIGKFLTSLTPADLGREFTLHWTPGDESTRVTMKVRDMLWHLVEEELQHRGEINALLWQKDLPVPILSWDDWVRGYH
jgi:uncharacterized damage-inducible protein DinB